MRSDRWGAHCSLWRNWSHSNATLQMDIGQALVPDRFSFLLACSTSRLTYADSAQEICFSVPTANPDLVRTPRNLLDGDPISLGGQLRVAGIQLVGPFPGLVRRVPEGVILGGGHHTLPNLKIHELVLMTPDRRDRSRSLRPRVGIGCPHLITDLDLNDRFDRAVSQEYPGIASERAGARCAPRASGIIGMAASPRLAPTRSPVDALLDQKSRHRGWRPPRLPAGAHSATH